MAQDSTGAARDQDLQNRLSFLSEQVGQVRSLVSRLQERSMQPDLRIIADELAFELDGITQSVKDISRALSQR